MRENKNPGYVGKQKLVGANLGPPIFILLKCTLSDDRGYDPEILW